MSYDHSVKVNKTEIAEKTPIKWQKMCEDEYGVSCNFMGSWKETYLIMLKYGMIHMNHKWMGKTLNEWLISEKITKTKLGDRLADACCPDDHPIGDFEIVYADMLDSGHGDQYFIEQGFSKEDIVQIKNVVHREIFILYHAINFTKPNKTMGFTSKFDNSEEPFAIGKVYAHFTVSPQRKRNIKELTDLYAKKQHILIAVLLFCNLTMQELVCIGI